jgi:hypothetical protein
MIDSTYPYTRLLMRRLSFVSMLFLFIIVAPIAAQDATTETGWPIEQRCVGDPTPPPDDWTYDGTILLTGYAGIHGVNAAWDTPRVLTFLNEDNLWGGALSPDGNWYASPRGNFTITESYNGITEIWEIRVFPVNGQRDSAYSIPYRETFFQYMHGQVYWKDNENFLYFDLINPVTGEIRVWNKPDSVWDAHPHKRSYFAPDWTRQIYYENENQPSWGIYNVENDEILDNLNITPPIAWKPDSSEFVATITDGTAMPSYSLALFDRDGVQDDVIVSAPEFEFGLFAIDWSADGRYLAFITFPFAYYSAERKVYSLAYYGFENTLYIADTEQKRIINTCMAVGEGLAWSPVAGVSQLAIMPPGEGTKDVLILDIEADTIYPVAQHFVTYNRRIDQGRGSFYSIIGWRAD